MAELTAQQQLLLNNAGISYDWRNPQPALDFLAKQGSPAAPAPVVPVAQPAAPATPQPVYAGGKAPDDPSNKYNTATGQLNPKYVAPAVPAATKTATPAPAQPAAVPAPSYSGSSIVDFLNQSGQNSSFAARSALATRYGIANYNGTAEQNTQLLGILRSQTVQRPTPAQTPAVGQPGTAGTAGKAANAQSNQPQDVEAIKAKIEQVKQQIATAQDQYAKEVGVQNLVQEAAKLGLDYPQEYLDSLIVPEKSDAEMRQAIYDKYGIANLETSAFQAPEKTFSQVYQQALADLGLTQKQAIFDAAMAELDKATADYNAGMEENNKNPWLHESGRVGSNRRLYEAYSATATRLQAKVTLAQNAIDQAKEDAKTMATQTISELERGQQLDQQKLEYLTQKAESELVAQKEMQKETTSKELARYYPEYVKNLNDKSAKTQIVNIGGQEILYSYDEKGNVLNKTVLGQAGSTTTQQNNAVTVNGLFTKAEVAQMTAGGLDSSLAANIYQAVMQGETLEEIRQDLKAMGKSPALLDVFDRAKPIYKILGNEKPASDGQFLNKDYFKKLYGDSLKKTAQEAGFTTGGIVGVGASGNVDAYLSDLMDKISVYRNSGYSDKEILNMMK